MKVERSNWEKTRCSLFQSIIAFVRAEGFFFFYLPQPNSQKHVLATSCCAHCSQTGLIFVACWKISLSFVSVITSETASLTPFSSPSSARTFLSRLETSSVKSSKNAEKTHNEKLHKKVRHPPGGRCNLNNLLWPHLRHHFEMQSQQCDRRASAVALFQI